MLPDEYYEVDELFDKIDALTSENAKLSRELDEIREGETLAKKKIEAEYGKAESLRYSAERAYALEMKAVKNFAIRWREYFVSTEASEREKSAMIDLLNDFLSEMGLKSDKEKVEKLAEKFGSGIVEKSADDEAFDLDAAINPPEDLDLEQLCKELGVFRG